jgi:hypothetical protein
LVVLESVHLVVPIPPEEHVVPVVAMDDVGPAPSVDRVVASSSGQVVGPIGPDYVVAEVGASEIFDVRAHVVPFSGLPVVRHVVGRD